MLTLVLQSSVKEILSRVEPRSALHPISHLPINPIPANLLIRNQLQNLETSDSSKKVESSTCYSRKQGPTRAPEVLLHSRATDSIPKWIKNSERPTLDDLCVAVKSQPYLPIKAEPQLHGPTYALRTAPCAPFTNVSLLKPDYIHQPQGTVVATSRVKWEPPPYGSSASKMASNDRHKLSEKHRRDGQYALTLATNILSKGLDPGLLSGCTICAEDAADQPLSFQSSFFSDSSTSTTEPVPAPKKTKNDMLEDNLKCFFSVLLHLWPSELGKRLDELRAEASRTAREREYGLRNDFAKSSKWHTDVRATVYEQLLSTMEMQCQRHGVLPWGADAGRSMMSPPKSPDSASSERNYPSPIIGQKRPREATVEVTQEERRVRKSFIHTAS
jgi:hypothetical protein